jgi:ubiquinol-cytochrome c reductase iron-sulfur subunit
MTVQRNTVYNTAPTSDQNRSARLDTRRHFLTVATAAAASVGIGFAAYPFLASLQPSAKAAADGGPVQVDLSPLQPGERITVAWRGKPVWVVRRTAEALRRMASVEWLAELRDPQSEVATQQPAYARNATRSIRDEYFVAIALCTHLGCVPLYEPQPGDARGSRPWVGGFFCPCHGSRFDLAGRVVKNVPAPTNLVIPPYRFVSSHRLEIGTDYTDTAENFDGNA